MSNDEQKTSATRTRIVNPLFLPSSCFQILMLLLPLFIIMLNIHPHATHVAHTYHLGSLFHSLFSHFFFAGNSLSSSSLFLSVPPLSDINTNHYHHHHHYNYHSIPHQTILLLHKHQSPREHAENKDKSSQWLNSLQRSLRKSSSLPQRITRTKLFSTSMRMFD